MNKQTEYKLNTIVSIIGLVILESMAIYKGLNGVMFSTVIIAVSGLGGFFIGKKLIK